MKATWCFLLLVVSFSSGCMDLPRLWQAGKPAPDPKAKPASQVKAPALPPKAITAEQVTEANARSKAEALDEEIARDEQALSQPAEPVVPDSKKPR